MKQQYLVLIVELEQIYALQVNTKNLEIQIVGRYRLELNQGELVGGKICNFTQLARLLREFLQFHHLAGLPVILVLSDQLAVHQVGLTSQVSWRQASDGYLSQIFDLGGCYYLTQVSAAQVLQYDLLLSRLQIYLEVVTGYSAGLLTYLRSYQPTKVNFNDVNFDQLGRMLASGNAQFDYDCVAMGAVMQRER